MRQSGDVADAEAFEAAFAPGRQEHQTGRDPREPGNAGLREGNAEQYTRGDGRGITASFEGLDGDAVQPAQLASTALKRKYSRLRGLS